MKTSQVNIRNCEPVNTESIQPSKIKKTVIAASGIAAAAGIGVAATIVAQKIGADEPVPEISENMDSSEAVTPVAPAGGHHGGRTHRETVEHAASGHTTSGHSAEAAGDIAVSDDEDNDAVIEPIVDADIDGSEFAEATITEATMFDDEPAYAYDEPAYAYGPVQTGIDEVPSEFNIEDEIPVLENTAYIESVPDPDMIIDVTMVDNTEAWPSPDVSAGEQDAWPDPSSDMDLWADVGAWSGEIEDVNRDTDAWPGETGTWPLANESNGEIAGI